MNLGGIKVGSVELEQVVNSHKDILESAAISVQLQGEATEKLIFYIVPKVNVEIENLKKELNSMLAKRLNPLFKIFKIVTIDKLPRTASNKIIRRLLRNQLE